MTDGRRHSLDIPISRTLVALRRVRSLRDPSTSSLSKFSALLDNVNWETSSSNGISLRFLNGCGEDGSDQNDHFGSKSLVPNGLTVEHGDDFKFLGGLEESKSRLVTCGNLDFDGNKGSPVKIRHVERLKDYQSNQEENNVIDHRHCNERYYSDDRDDELDLGCITPSSHHLEGVDLSNGQIVGSLTLERIDCSASKRKPRYKNQVKSLREIGDLASHVDSPCLSASDALSSRSIPIFANEGVDRLDYENHGCGIRCCWSGTPKFRGSNHSFDVEGRPLLSGDLDETGLNGQKNLKCSNEEITPYSENSRSLSQKFRPKSFNDLVGQNVVVRSLLGAISRGKITSFYLFHGPRGTGKTSASRIFAAALNCLSLEEHKPCGLCRECLTFFSGRSNDVKEVDSVKINRTDRVRSLIKDATIPPISSRFKIFIIDECQLLRGETWATILNSLEKLSQHVVFVMITPDLDKLPRSAVSRSQRYHFPTIKDSDVAIRLEKICVDEGFDFDQDALDFIATKSNGSLRDAEMMIEQLSLLSKKITMSSAYELIGIVSDDELLDLLDLALSSDTSNTVIRARELMRSRIDPMQLISQLANLIMDVLAGNCHKGGSEARRRFSRRHTTEADLQKLSHALKILSETEKQLRLSKNQTTWLTVALLQLSHVEASSLDTNDTKLCLRDAEKGHDFYSTSPAGGSSQLLVTCSHDESKSHKFGTQEECERALASIWKKAIELCQSSSLKNFLRKHGKMSSLCVNQGLAVAELEFHHPDYVSRAEKSWKLIAGSLQSILGLNVEIRINLVPQATVSKGSKVRKLSFSLFGCSRRMQHKSQSATEHGSNSDYSDYNSEKPNLRDRPILRCSDCRSHMAHNYSHRMEAVRTVRNSEGNVLSEGTTLSQRSLQVDTPKTPGGGVDSSKEEGSNCGYRGLSFRETEDSPNCFPRTLWLKKKLHSPDTSHTICTTDQPKNNLDFSFPRNPSFETCICASDPCSVCGGSKKYLNSSRDGDRLGENSDVLCWKTPSFHPSKAWELPQQRRRSHLVRWVLPCATAK